MKAAGDFPGSSPERDLHVPMPGGKTGACKGRESSDDAAEAVRTRRRQREMLRTFYRSFVAGGEPAACGAEQRNRAASGDTGGRSASGPGCGRAWTVSHRCGRTLDRGMKPAYPAGVCVPCVRSPKSRYAAAGRAARKTVHRAARATGKRGVWARTDCSAAKRPGSSPLMVPTERMQLRGGREPIHARRMTAGQTRSFPNSGRSTRARTVPKARPGLPWCRYESEFRPEPATGSTAPCRTQPRPQRTAAPRH